MIWKTTKPRKVRTMSIKLRYKDKSGKIYSGNFVWSEQENTWVECVEGEDGIGLYKEDGYKILG